MRRASEMVPKARRSALRSAAATERMPLPVASASEAHQLELLKLLRTENLLHWRQVLEENEFRVADLASWDVSDLVRALSLPAAPVARLLNAAKKWQQELEETEADDRLAAAKAGRSRC